MKSISVIIPIREVGSAEVTLHSLAQQTLQDFDVIVSWDQGHGANWARNQGLAQAQTSFVLCSDDDIEWEPDALEVLHDCLLRHPEASYSYGSYYMPGVGEQCNVTFDAARLRKGNFISTMSLVRRADHPGFDETVQRAQDWDLWLTMLEQGKVGVYCGRRVFQSMVRPGITYGNGVSWPEATRIVRAKHGLSIPCRSSS